MLEIIKEEAKTKEEALENILKQTNLTQDDFFLKSDLSHFWLDNVVKITLLFFDISAGFIGAMISEFWEESSFPIILILRRSPKWKNTKT